MAAAVLREGKTVAQINLGLYSSQSQLAVKTIVQVVVIVARTSSNVETIVE